MDQDFRPPADQSDDPALPSVDEVVERLGRLWSPATPLAVADSELRQLRLGRYQLRELRGQGAFGVVYLARDTQLDRDVALKVPRSQVLADPDKRRRFESEASAAAMLDHPGIVTVYEADLASPTPYMASAYCSGPDLGEWLASEHTAVTWREAAEFVAHLADAVDYAHQRGVFHRDLKPSNILLVPVDHATGEGSCLADFAPKITDFGLAKLAQVAIAETRSSMLLGTPLYMAPEQLESNRHAPPAAADIYSLGCLLYELITGRLPIEGDSYVQILDRLRDQPPALLRRLVPAAPRDLEKICAQCLEKDPSARYASAADLAADLRSCIAGAPIQAREAGWVSRIKYWCTRPQRIRDAGWYMMCVQSMLIVWLIIVSLGANLVIDLPLVAFKQIAAELCVFIFAIHLPMAVVGWFTIRGYRWALHAGLYLTLINLIAPAGFFLLPSPPLYADIYSRVEESKYVAFSTCTLVLVAELGQVVLYVAALAAWRRMGRQEANRRLSV
jgi:hypothetical protein